MIVRCRGAAPGSGTAPERTTRHCQDDARMSRLTVAYHHGDLPTALLAAVAGLPPEALVPDIVFASAGSVEGRGNLLGE